MRMNIFKELVISKITLTEKLLNEISDYDIYCELTKIEFDLGVSVISPIRDDDDNPSFSLFIPTKKSNVREEEIWWRDFRDGSGDVFKFSKLLALNKYGLQLETRAQIIKFIDFEINLGLFDQQDKAPYIKRDIDYNRAREQRDILFKSREFTQRDLIWWASIGVDIDLLTSHDIRSIRYLLDDDFNVRSTISMYDLAFAFVVYDKVKIYRPELGHGRKWKNTCPSEYIQGWAQLSNKDTLIITKSYKDLLVFKSFMNVDVIAPQSESGSFTQVHIDFIKSQYKNVFVVYDYDDAGKIGANKLQDAHNFSVKWVSTSIDPYTEKPIDKDISDYMSNHGIEHGFKRMQSIFKELNSTYFKENRVNYFKTLLNNLTYN